MKKIIIHKPEIKKGIDSVHCRLSAIIESDHFKKELYYEVENRYKEYLCYERGDAFMLSLLYFAMINGYDMEIKAPISEKLYYQLTKQYIPTMVKYIPKLFHRIEINAPLDSIPIKNAGAVGASVSGGVDSFYSILKNTDLKETNFNITHLMVANVYNMYNDENTMRKKFKDREELALKISNALNLQPVIIYTNEHIFWHKKYQDLYMTRYMGIVYALQKLFSVYNFSSGYEYKDFELSEKTGDHYDFLTAQLISNENLTIYSSGPEAGRIEKLEYIVDDPVVQKYLQVCNINTENCSACDKCMRTQLELWAIGKLDKFTNTFETGFFYKHKDRKLAFLFTRNSPFDREIIQKIQNSKNKEVHIPLYITIAQPILKSIGIPFRKFPALMNTYHKIRAYKTKDANTRLHEGFLYSDNFEYAKKCDAEIVK